MFRPTWPSSGVYDVSLLYSWRNLLRCFCYIFLHKERQESKHAHKNQETNENTKKNTNENVHSITTCKKRQQKQRSRFLQEYKSETSYTPEDGHVGRNMLCRTATTKRKTIYNKAARRRQHNLKTYWTIQCRRMLKYNIINKSKLKEKLGNYFLHERSPTLEVLVHVNSDTSFSVFQ
jgi:hypothetical protein